MNSIMIQIIFIAICYLLSLVFPKITSFPSAGLWPLALCEITILCLANPESPLSMFMIPCPIKAKYYPWALFGFFTLLSGFSVIQFDILAGIIYGHLFFFYLKDKIQFSDTCFNKCQENCVFNKLKGFSGFIPLAAANGFTMSSPAIPQDSPSDSNGTAFQAFKGSGTTIGTFDTQTKAAPQVPVQQQIQKPDIIISGQQYRQLKEEDIIIEKLDESNDKSNRV